MEPSSVIDLKAFVPAKDYGLSKQFYAELGFKLNWESDQAAELQIGEFRFLLQNYYIKEFTDNFMMHLMVDDADAWWRHISDIRLTEKYPGITAKAPTLQPWDLRVLYLTDPTGVLWHISDGKNA